MAKITKPLTDTEVKQAKPKDKEYSLADGKGLLLRVKTNGSKLWIFNYSRPYNKRRANISFGVYPDLSLANARIRRQEARELLANNIDPKEHKAEINRTQLNALNNTFKIVAKSWFDIHKKKIANKTSNDIWRTFENHLFPSLGNYPINKLRATEVIDVIKPLAAKGSLESVRKLCQRINKVMVFALNTGVIHTNPLAGIHQAFDPPKPKNLPTIKPEELPSLMLAINRANIQIVTRCLMEWQLHTMVRPSEAAGAQWSEVNMQDAIWTIPKERMKKNREHIVPLTTQALTLLKVVEPISGHRKFIFPSYQSIHKAVNSETVNKALKRMGYSGKLVAHGFRALASTTLNEQGFDPDVIEAALAHVDKNEVRRAYNRAEYLERRRVMMQWWSNHIDNASTGNFSLSSSFNGLTSIK